MSETYAYWLQALLAEAAATIGPWLLNGVATVQYDVIVDLEVALAGSWTRRVLKFGGRARDEVLDNILFGQAQGGSVRGRAREPASRGHASPRQVSASDN